MILVFLLSVAGPLLAQEPVPTPAQATETPGPAPASDGGPTVSAPPVLAAPAAGGVRLRSGVVPGRPVSLTRGAASTVTGYEEGKSLTVKTPAGTLVRYRLAKDASVPDGLAAGRTVLVETKIVKKRRYASRVTYAESRVVMTNVD
ncbi:MAG: hypothetical protein NEA02_12815 [Thermoanaerobaculia bacterium]|nr:hypothetical protein [Thermoanaerobaculia bacterium]